METQGQSAKGSSAEVLQRIETVARELVDMQLADLRRIADIGMEIIEGLGRMAHEAEAAPDVPRRNSAAPGADSVVLSFARASRAVRLTFAMQTDLVERLRRAEASKDFGGDFGGLAADLARAFAPPGSAQRPAPTQPLTPEQAAERARKDSIAGVMNSIIRDSAASDRERQERLVREASECLTDREQFGDILKRPMSEVIAHVCAELGIDPDWRWLSAMPWAREEMQSEMVGEALRSCASPAGGGGGPMPPPEGAQPPPDAALDAPSVTALAPRATFPANGEGERPGRPRPACPP